MQQSSPGGQDNSNSVAGWSSLDCQAAGLHLLPLDLCNVSLPPSNFPSIVVVLIAAPGSSRASGNVSLIVGEPYCLPGELMEGIVGSEILGKDGAVWRMALNVIVVLTEGLRRPWSQCAWTSSEVSWAQRRHCQVV